MLLALRLVADQLMVEEVLAGDQAGVGVQDHAQRDAPGRLAARRPAGTRPEPDEPLEPDEPEPD